MFFLTVLFLSINAFYSTSIIAQTTDTSKEPIESSINNFKSIEIFCTTNLTPTEIKKVLPDFKIDSKTSKQTNPQESLNAASPTTFCPQKIITLKPSNKALIAEEELQEVARQITKIYIDKGYINSRAIPIIDNPGNIARIVVDEGKVDVVVEGTKRLQNYVRSRLELATNPLNTKKLEDQLRLLKDDPLFNNIEATLQPGKVKNQTQLKVTVTEATRISGSVGFDNFSPPSVGGERFGMGLAYRNLTGLGDEISVGYSPRLENFATYGLDFGYRVPINAMNGTIQANIGINRNEVIQGELEQLDIQGESERYSLTYRQPVVRTPVIESAISVGFDYQDGQTFTFQGATPFGFGPDEDGVSRTSVFHLGYEYTKRDTAGAWGWRSRLRWGTGLFGATENDSPIPDGKFISFLTQLQRLQVINNSNFLIFQADLQATPNTLLPSEQFSIGGGQSVRGYRQNVRSGDQGIRFSVEDRLTVARNSNGDSVFVIAPFADLAYVWQTIGNPNQIPDGQFIAGAGLGLLLQPIENLNMRLDYAPPLIDLSDRGDDIQDDGWHFSAGYSF
ncbi:ShlB/FhaC/HecB family hemolysin secretion/activation protein [Waterburya agarophytonicola K14]|uniref:ShlB/FhaC/HecB family hemolysin secretion/activation protein n=1 Tax=Waterburya agarophytonicola KI4 TaxID=2874699 RepID=A0A964FEK1_9CYAN|nr:ShlB/FhaC/HecB family hemolysin secretion/activation protein [Waterburya agarophytonicola]MCC0175992.1 ShlB/FhaC/HecB family hemolysin secretion/activation protein [Waterburya agarophytonicola KI4]